MSYIRSTSNTEHIYIFESNDGIEIMKSHDEHYVIPTSIFVNLIRKHILDLGCKEDYKYRGASLKFYVDCGICMWCLKYKDINFSFSYAVLDYIIHNNAYNFCNKKEYMEFACFRKFKFSPWNKKKETK